MAGRALFIRGPMWTCLLSHAANRHAGVGPEGFPHLVAARKQARTEKEREGVMRRGWRRERVGEMGGREGER